MTFRIGWFVFMEEETAQLVASRKRGGIVVTDGDVGDELANFGWPGRWWVMAC